MATHTIPAFATRLAFGLPLVLACLAAPPARAGEQEFDQALQSYRTGRLSDAYGRFLALGLQGDPDAARFALTLHSDGTMLRTFWELTDEDAVVLRRMAQRPSLRPQPQPDMAGYDAVGIAHGPRKQEQVAGNN